MYKPYWNRIVLVFNPVLILNCKVTIQFKMSFIFSEIYRFSYLNQFTLRNQHHNPNKLEDVVVLSVSLASFSQTWMLYATDNEGLKITKFVKCDYLVGIRRVNI